MSKIIKASFVAMSEIRKEIQTIDPNNPNIIRSIHNEGHSKPFHKGEQNELYNRDEAAIDDDVINGSHIIAREAMEAEIEKMLKGAQLEATRIKEDARDEGFEKGYEKGYEEGVMAAKEAIDDKIDELEAEQLEWHKTYKKNVALLEPKIAEVIRNLVVRMVGSHDDDPDLILYLVRLAFEEINTYGSIIIKCSADDFDYLVENKEVLRSNLSEKVGLEILKELTLEKNQCLIETDMGNIDCSLSVRLAGIDKELKLIGDSLTNNAAD